MTDTNVIYADNVAIEPFICAFIISPYKVDIEDLKAYLCRQIPSYMIPSRIIQVENIPTTSQGKTDKNTLIEKHLRQGNEQDRKIIGIELDIPGTIKNMWENILGIKDIELDKDFFELGGSSLLGTLLVTMIESEYDISLPAEKLLSAPTIRAISELVSEYAGCE